MPVPLARDLLLSADALRAVDRAADRAGLPLNVLMEQAARGVADFVYEHAPSGTVHVLCGKGHNGGDGLCAARLLAARGRAVVVWIVAGADELSDLAREQLRRLHVVAEWCPDRILVHHERAPELGGAAIVVDALLGTGARGEPREPLPLWIARANEAAALRLAIDLPTGLDAQTGRASRTCFRADSTLALTARSPGHVFHEGPARCGAVVVLPVGLPDELLALHAGSQSAVQTSDAWASSVWPRRAAGAHKFTAGSVVVIGGSLDYQGAPVLASRAAARGGAGYVTCVVPAAAAASARAHLVAEVVREASGSPDHFAPGALVGLEQAVERADAVVIGPGVGRSDATQRFVRQLLASLRVPVVVDADALFALDPDVLAALPPAPRVLTPHAGEFERLTGEAASDNRIEQARRWSDRLGATLVLKGTPTVTAHPDGRCWVAPSAPTSLAAAGTGDTLSGVIGALLAQGVDDAAALGVHLGCRAAERLERAMRPEAVTAPDLIDALGARAS